MIARRAVLGAVLGAALAVSAGCTSSGSSSSKPSAPSSGPARSSSAATDPGPSNAPTGTAVPAGPLATRMQRALAPATSVHLALSTAVAGSSTIKGAGDLALHAGAIARADLTEALPDGLGDVHLIVVGRQTYAELPAGLAPKDKPWTLLSASDPQPLVARLTGTVESVLTVAAPATVITFVRAASSVRDLGAATVDGTAARHYRVVIAAQKLAALPGGLTSGSSGPVPIDLYLDRTGRPVELRGTLELSGVRLTPTVTLSGYDRAVHISAPPASQVSG